MAMTKFSVKRMLAAVGMGVALLAGTMFHAEHAAGQGGDNGIVGTWTSRVPDGQGGTNQTWYTFGPDGSYRMVAYIQGGRHNGSVTQRWGSYQARPAGQWQYQTTVQVKGGAPTQDCTPGMGCTPVQGIQRTMQWQMQVRNGQLMNGGSVFQRGQVPQQLAQNVAGTTTINAPTMPTLHPYKTPGGGTSGNPSGRAGLGKNCDDAHQAQICHYAANGGAYLKDQATGCMVCQTY